MFNQVILQGRLGKDPELKKTGSGLSVVNFSIATDDIKKAGEGYEKITDWHNVVCFARVADNTDKYVSKGDIVTVVGKLKTEHYEKDGQKRYITKVYADKVIFGQRDPKQAPPKPPKPQNIESDFRTIEEDEIPF